MAAKIPISLKTADFTKRDDIIALFPAYKQLQLAARKPLPKNVNIEYFTLKTPYGDQTLLSNTPLTFEPHRRQCLFGPNSSGKTLLFNAMVSGEIAEWPKHIHVHHCKELENHELTDTVLNTVVNSHPYRNALVKVEARLRELIAANPEPKTLSGLKENLEFVVSQMNGIAGYNAAEKAIKMLRVLGFDEVGQNKLCSALSGGLRMRVALCMAFFIEADFLLLDEPTNHLDFPSVLWLENRLRGYKGSFLLVSHDRELLNNTVTSVILIEDKQLKYYPLGFADFEKKKTLEDRQKNDEIDKFLAKNKNPNPSTQVGRQAIDKRKWQQEYQQKVVALQGKFTFPAPVALTTTETKVVDGAQVAIDQADISLIKMDNVRFSYDVATGHFIFNDPISFNVTGGTRVGVMGPNGAGKSTFLKLLTHKLTPVSGTVTEHPNFTLAYFGQHSTAELNLELTAIEFMTLQFPDEGGGKLRSHLSKTGILGTAADTRMGSLSFSQRSCIVFAKLTYVCPHLLIMDEPTNFLDLESVDSLIQACNKYKGALLLVSHNRDFLKKCAKQYLSIVPGQFNLYDTLKVAEKATYTFIEDMESGGKIDAKAAIENNPGGGSIHSSQKIENKPTAAKPATAVKTVTAVPAKTATVTAAPVAVAAKTAPAASTTATTAAPAQEKKELIVTFDKDEKVSALWTDGKWYPAEIRAFNQQSGKYTVYYTEYGNSVALAPQDIRKWVEQTQKKPQTQNTGNQRPNNRNQNSRR